MFNFLVVCLENVTNKVIKDNRKSSLTAFISRARAGLTNSLIILVGLANRSSQQPAFSIGILLLSSHSQQ